MANFKLPLSGDVAQTINPWTAVFSPYGGQFGLININLGRSSAPQVEEDVLADVGSYGKQLGRIGDAMAVLLAHFHPQCELTAQEREAIDALKAMLEEIDAIKRRHHRTVTAP
ncbi:MULTISPECIES: hypothetical protein [unclassified Methylosinus]|jgi:hypothetical protein|uniref:hypothetical protein n=1 Tax=unclassified Methylosinus TaxID=2624500 RepID=UPI000463B02C|nr:MULTISPECIES: hypothetical protein [unclassified Methylosinus]TDX63980.1 hypothetical protein EDE12_106125 [Methylosinus sp. sav-2]